MKKKKSLPSNDYINNKKDDFKDYIEKVASGEVSITTNKETVTDKLILIKDELTILKDKRIPYSTLVRILADKLDLVVSEQTLRSFCQSRLGFEKKSRGGKAKKIVQKDNSTYNAKEGLSDNNNEFK